MSSSYSWKLTGFFLSSGIKHNNCVFIDGRNDGTLMRRISENNNMIANVDIVSHTEGWKQNLIYAAVIIH